MGFYLELFSRNVAQCYGAGFLAVGYVIGARDNSEKTFSFPKKQKTYIRETGGSDQAMF